jgi:prepilin-type N-terminal cleavage/methylation domain-containing protein
MKSKQSGFTLAEMAMVIAVLGLLSALILPSFDGMVASARKAQVKQLAHQLNQGAIAVNALAIGDNAVTGDTIQYGTTSVTLEEGYPNTATVRNVLGDSVQNVQGGADLIDTVCTTSGVLFAEAASSGIFQICNKGAVLANCNVQYVEPTGPTVGPTITVTTSGCGNSTTTPEVVINN